MVVSKIMEALKKPLKESQPRPRDLTQQQLADVYFQSSEKVQMPPVPTIIRVEDKQRTFFWPWIITTLSLVLCCLALFTTKRIAIDVRIMDDAAATAPARRALVDDEASARPLATSVSEARTLSPTDFTLHGAAVLNSTRDANQLTIANSTLSGLAYAAYNFTPSFDANGYAISFEARGKNGGEQLELIFKDSAGNSSLNWKTLIPFPNKLTTEWQTVTLRLANTDFFKTNAITQLRLEVGSQRTGNAPDEVIFVRNIQWLPANK